MKVEFLAAFEDGTWDTIIEEVPDHVAFGQERGPCTVWAENNLSGQAQYRGVVMWAVYSFPEESPQTHEEDFASGCKKLCPICGETVSLSGWTKDGRLIGSCGDAFTPEQWNRPE